MFRSKLTNLFVTKEQPTSAPSKEEAKTLSGNNAVKYSSTDNPFVTEFGQLASFKSPRRFEEVSTSMRTLWDLNPLLTTMFTLYIRMITRVTQLFDGLRTASPQRGAGLRYEGIMRMLWIAIYYPDSFWKNIRLFISVGSWKDIIQMLSLDLQYHGWAHRKLDWDKMGMLILAGLENPNTTQLLKKYLPQIKSNPSCTTTESQADNIIAKWICSLLFGTKNNGYTYKQYRKLKASGIAHQWQQFISRGEFLKIDFNTIHGRALAQLVSGKFLKNQGLEKKYEEWIMNRPIAKFTGYVHELFSFPNLYALKKHQKDTINSQFMGLVEKARTGAIKNSKLLVALDVSGSMNSTAHGTKMSSAMLARIIAVFYSYLHDSIFSTFFVEFASTTRARMWEGKTPLDRVTQGVRQAVGSTNIQSVIDFLIDFTKNKSIPEEILPSGILCISDGEFDATNYSKTNLEEMRLKLARAGFSEEYLNNFKVVIWNIPNSFYSSRAKSKFETYDTKARNVFYFSGFDPSVIAFLTGVEGPVRSINSAADLFAAAMDQQILKMVEV